MHPLLEKIERREARVAVLGQGYVGLVVAMRAAEVGYPVVGLDVDERIVAGLSAGESHIEDVSDELLRGALARGYLPTTDPADLAGFDIAVIDVPTPLHEGQPDLSAIRAAARMVGEHLASGALVILESTTYPGTTEELVAEILTERSGLTPGDGFLLGYSPERIDPGNRTHEFATIPKVVSGVDDASLEAVVAFFGSLVDKVVPVSSPRVAEMTKLVENTFRHVNIALVNELAMFAHDLEVNIWEAIDAAATKPFGFMPFRPGPGVGGHCLPIDPTYLSWRVKRHLGEQFRFIELANDVNEHMPQYVATRVQALLNRDRLAVNGSKILVLGLAYKPGVGDHRETPSVPIIRRLQSLGAEIVAVDPYVDPSNFDSVDEVHTSVDRGMLEAADLVLVVTDHDEFDYDLVTSTATRVLDTRNRLPHAPNVEHL